MRSRTQRFHALVIGLIVATTACGAADLVDEQATTWPGDPGVELQTVDIGFGLQAGVPASWEVSAITDEPSSEIPDGCQSRSGSLATDATATDVIEIQLNQRGCDVPRAENRLRRYVRAANAGDVTERVEFETPIGPATMFLDRVEHCSSVTQVNGEELENPEVNCSEIAERVALVELSDPLDPDFGVLQLELTDSVDGESVIAGNTDEHLRAVLQSMSRS